MLGSPTTAEPGTAIDGLLGTDGKPLPGVDVPQPLPAIGGVESSPESLPAAPEAPYQVMPHLTSEEYDSLKSDIELRGIQVPILVDEQGQIIDGHHRKQIADRLGIECPTDRREGLTEVQKRELAVALNTKRRHLTREQQQKIINEFLLAAPEKSDRHIAKVVGVDHKTVSARRREKESTGEIPQLNGRVGKDGRTRKARPETPNATPPVEMAPAPLPADTVLQQYSQACNAVSQLAKGGRLAPGVAYDLNTRSRSVLTLTLPAMRERERKKAVEDLEALIAAPGGRE